VTSEAFAAWIGARRDESVQHIVFAIGPASGWSPAALPRARLPPRPSRTALPRLHTPHWPPLPHRSLKSSS
jgi:23S rRNA (pseudouridine1915-N3)-methyltransferase